MRLILVPTAPRPECAVALDVAFKIARSLEADVLACHVRTERSDGDPTVGQLMPDDLYEHVDQPDGERRLTSEAAQQLFVRTAGAHGFEVLRRAAVGRRSQALWREAAGTPARVFSIIGPVADMAVVSRPKAKSAGRARAFLLAAVLHSVKPVLIVPQKRSTRVGTTIVIAWNQSPEAAMAVSAAIPMLQRAKRVVVVSAGPEHRAGPKSSQLAKYLMHWDVQTETVHSKGRDVERELEQAYRSVGGDLLVMGAYSRPRFHQLVFGGVTERMLFKTDIPVLMLHR